MRRLAISILITSMPVIAQEVQTQFPEGSALLTTETLTAALSGKVYTAQPAKGPSWRIQYNDNGFVYVNVGSFSDTGKWFAKDSTVCSEGRQIKFFCNEVRTKDNTLYLKRESGEVLKLELR